MKKNRILFVFTTILLTVTFFCQCVFSDTKVNSILGILSELEDIAEDNGGTLDYDNYNEALVSAYLSAVYDKDVSELTEEDISKEFNNIFDNDDGKYKTKKIGSIMENSDIEREIRNKFDHNFYGEISTLATVKSHGYYISQNSHRYYDLPYSGSNMHVYGCGPISLTVALNIVSEEAKFDAKDLADWARDNGYMSPDSGTAWDFINECAEANGYTAARTIIRNADEFRAAFADDTAVIVAVMNTGVFTDDGHFIVLAGMDSEDKIRVLDSMSIYRTNKNWSVEQILKESKGAFWVIKR